MEEHNQWIALLKKIHNEGYSIEEVEELRRCYKEQIASASVKEKDAFRELNLGRSIWRDIDTKGTEKTQSDEINREKEIEMDRKEQPRR